MSLSKVLLRVENTLVAFLQESTASVVTIEASTYSPLTDQDRIVDAGTYINI